MSKIVVWAIAAVAAIIGLVVFINNVGNDGSTRGPIPGFAEKSSVAIPTQANAAAPEVNVPAVPTKAETTLPPTTVPVAPQNGQGTTTVAAPGTTVNVIVNCCPSQPCQTPKAVSKKSKAKKIVAKKVRRAEPAPTVGVAPSRPCDCSKYAWNPADSPRQPAPGHVSTRIF